MFSQFYVLSPRGDSIIYRNFRNEISQSATEQFFRNVRFYDGKQQEAPPIFESDGLHYLWLKRNGLYFVLTATTNVSPSMGLELLVRVTKLFKDYCGVLTEESVRANFTLVYEVLDEVFDYGLPQSTTNDTLKPYVFNEPISVTKTTIDPTSIITKLPISFSSKTSAATNAEIPLSAQQKEKQNHVYVDIYEKINYCVSASGQVLLQTIDGSIQMKSYVPGAPPLLLQLNEDLVVNKEGNQTQNSSLYPVELDDCSFHECVNHDNFEQTKALIITPREGEVNIMNYRLSPLTMKLPFKVFPHLEMTDTRKIELLIKFRSEYASNINAAQVLVHIPMPSTTVSVFLDSRVGIQQPGSNSSFEHSAEYDPKEKLVRWRMRKLPGATELVLVCRISLSEPHTVYTRKEIGPIASMFEIPMYSTSAIQVKSLRPVNPRSAPPQRWVRCLTRSNSYLHRL